MRRHGCVFIVLVTGMLVFQAAFMPTDPAHACGPVFMSNYLVMEEGNPVDLPSMSFWSEMQCLIKFAPIPPEEQPLPIDDAEPLEGIEKMRTRTMNVDVADFAEAVKADPNANARIASYTAMRKTMLAWIMTLENKEEEERIKKRGWGEVKKSPQTSFDLTQYEDFLRTIPAEFSEYVRGAYAFHRGEMAAATPHFEAVLQLSPAQRKYRSVWAAYMLGKIRKDSEPEQAFQHFDQVRAMVKEGYPDPFNFSGESLAWQAFIDANRNRPVDALHRYVQCGSEKMLPGIIIPSIRWVCNSILKQPNPDSTVLNDPLSREILLIALSFENKEKQDTWLAACEKMAEQNAFPGADRLAWLAYQRGDFIHAEKWLKHCDPVSPRAKWIDAKLLLRSGKLQSGGTRMQEVIQESRNLPEWAVSTEPIDSYPETRPVHECALAEMAVTRLSRQDYVGAMDAFLRGRYWPDAAYIAERLIPMTGKDSLEAYLAAHTENDPELSKPIEQWPNPPAAPLDKIRDIMARRLARNGEWEKAARYYALPHTESFSEDGLEPKTRPAADYAQMAQTIAANLKCAHDPAQPATAKAKALLETAKLLREHGMELTGTELAPDWALEGGSYEWDYAFSDRLTQEKGAYNAGDPDKELGEQYLAQGIVCQVYNGDSSHHPSVLFRVTADEVARRMESAAKPYKRYHYRYVAADMLWSCAQLLPNNDPLCAEALYRGGTYLQNRDPLAADKFYKALIRRNPNLAIAQEANKLKWFPPKFTDEILYHSPAKTFRKRTLAIWGASGLALLLFAGVTIYKGIKNHSTTGQGKV